ncbi:damage-control phosphatase [[Candida] railenensis]|uniref:Sugar phosphate phosphatase n=1 Tax=[Candida] railenensis TaxID=45579 RepID=A0A9P0QMC8_9ASCO|nr:damage-control phosphatase [[Candida] railenensis]
MSLPTVYYNDDPKSFAHPTCHKRWPIILKDSIRDVKKQIVPSNAEAGDEIVSKLSNLLEALESDAKVLPFTEEEIALNADLSHYNVTLAEFNSKKEVTWLTGPWLFLECYIYQLINLYILQTKNEFWIKKFDFFEDLKNQTFKQSEFGVLELCKRYELLSEQIKGENIDLETLKLLFNEFIDVSLWGNATDLSLLAGNVTLEDIKSVQGAEVRKKNEEKILINDLEDAWKKIAASENTNKRIDIVLDNSGFELFTDLVLGLFLLDTKLISELHLHVKSIPWFVSDTMTKDFHNLLDQLVDPKFFEETIHKDQDNEKAIKYLHSKLVGYFENGNIKIDEHKFWTLDYNYWQIPKETDLYNSLLKSDLIIFKGDLNYRKLTGDLMWDKTTPFKTAIQDLATSKLPILSLRTCKADVVVGLPEGVNEKLIKTYKEMGNDIGEFWTSSGKWAVISFNN